MSKELCCAQCSSKQAPKEGRPQLSCLSGLCLLWTVTSPQAPALTPAQAVLLGPLCGRHAHHPCQRHRGAGALACPASKGLEAAVVQWLAVVQRLAIEQWLAIVQWLVVVQWLANVQSLAIVQWLAHCCNSI
eukprot:1138641-Pelagomonas_calceolata.AAC.2